MFKKQARQTAMDRPEKQFYFISFKRYGSKTLIWRPFFLPRMGNTASTVFDLPLSTVLYKIKENEIKIITLT